MDRALMIGDQEPGLEGEFWFAWFHKVTPLLLRRLKACGCKVFQGNEVHYGRVYALCGNKEELARLMMRHHRLAGWMNGPYKGVLSWMKEGNHKRL